MIEMLFGKKGNGSVSDRNKLHSALKGNIPPDITDVIIRASSEDDSAEGLFAEGLLNIRSGNVNTGLFLLPSIIDIDRRYQRDAADTASDFLRTYALDYIKGRAANMMDIRLLAIYSTTVVNFNISDRMLSASLLVFLLDNLNICKSLDEGMRYAETIRDLTVATLSICADPIVQQTYIDRVAVNLSTVIGHIGSIAKQSGIDANELTSRVMAMESTFLQLHISLSEIIKKYSEKEMENMSYPWMRSEMPLCYYKDIYSMIETAESHYEPGCCPKDIFPFLKDMADKYAYDLIHPTEELLKSGGPCFSPGEEDGLIESSVIYDR